MESLIKSGALDGLDMTRRQMIYMLPEIIAQIDGDRGRNIAGQIGFFDEDSPFAQLDEPKAPDLGEFDRDVLLENEKEITGLYLSGHPLDRYADIAAQIGADRVCDLLLAGEESAQNADGKQVKLFGMVTGVQKKQTKNGDTMAFVRMEDMTGTIECIVFAKLYRENMLLLQQGSVVLLEGVRLGGVSEGKYLLSAAPWKA